MFHRGHRRNEGGAPLHVWPKVFHSNLSAFSPALPDTKELKSMAPTVIQALFCALAIALKNGMQALLSGKSRAWLHEAMDYIAKACCLID